MNRLWIIVAGFALVMGGCQGAQERSTGTGGTEGMQKAEAPGSSGQAAESPGPAAIKMAAMQQAQPDRYLIRNATVTLEVKDARAATTRLTEAVRVAHGYLSDMHESVDGLGARSVTVTVRVPADGFEQSMGALTGLGKVLDKQVTTEDVTEEFVDSTSRLRNLKSTEERLLAHLSRTGKLSDTLLVEKELARVRLEIEQLEGRLRYLSHRVAYSTIQMTLKEAARPQAVTPPESYSTGQVATDAARSLVEFLRGVATLGIWLGIWAAVWGPVLAVALYFRWRSRRAISGAAGGFDRHQSPGL